MKAIICTKYGPPDVLELKEVKKPIPKSNEVLIKIHATTVTMGDCELRSFRIPPLYWLPLRLYIGIREPRINIFGQDLAGEIEDVGSAVTNFKKGDEVFCPTKMSFGGYAEYICLPADWVIVKKPTNMTYEQTAAVPTGGLNALHFIRKSNLMHNQKVLIIGAAGCIGTFAVQMAKSIGTEVTCVDSTEKLSMLQTLGADHVIDYTKEDYTKLGRSYDVIIDIAGKSPFSGCVKSLTKNGRYILGNPSFTGIVRAAWTSMISDKKVIVALAPYNREDLIFLKEQIESGQLKSVIDKCYPLEQMSDAHRYVDSGSKKGCVAISIVRGENTAKSIS